MDKDRLDAIQMIAMLDKQFTYAEIMDVIPIIVSSMLIVRKISEKEKLARATALHVLITKLIKESDDYLKDKSNKA